MANVTLGQAAEALAGQSPVVSPNGAVTATLEPPSTTTWDDVVQVLNKWLIVKDFGAVRLPIALIGAHPIVGEPVWLFLVAPPSSLKTETIRALAGYPGTFSLSDLTAKTFASGLMGDRDPSLLKRLKNEVVLLKDFTTILTKRQDERQEILAQLRELHDGYYVKTFGNGKVVEWEGKLGFIAGVTPVIDTYSSVSAVLGERFVMYRVEAPSRTEVSRRVQKNAGKEVQMRKEIATIIQGYLKGLPVPDSLPQPEGFEDRIAALADFVSLARSGVVRDGYSRDVVYIPEPEGPGRLSKQLATILASLAILRGGTANEEDYALVYKLGIDCLPRQRERVFEVLNETDQWTTTADVAEGSGYPTSSARRFLEDLRALEVLDIDKGGQGHPDKWRISDMAADLLFKAAPEYAWGTFPEYPEGGIDADT